MRASPQLVLILAAIAAVEASRGSKCRHGRPKNGNSVPDVSADPHLVTSEDASSIVSSISTTVELVKTGQAQTVVSTALTVPTETPQVTEPAIDAGDAQPREQGASS